MDFKKKLLKEGELVDGRYLVVKLIGVGSFGQVYMAKDQNVTGRKVAIKVERVRVGDWLINPFSTLHLENMILNELNGGRLQRYRRTQGGFPKVYHFGNHNKNQLKVLVMEMLGPSLERLGAICNYKFSVGTVFVLADQLLYRLEYLHGKGYIHRDFKPDNIVMGSGNRKDDVHLIDFGLSKLYWKDKDTKEHIKEIGGRHVGTTRYMSRGAHQSNQQSRRSDMESLVYVLAHFLTGALPWQKLKGATKRQKSEKILEMKLSTTPEDLFQGHPQVFVEFFKLIGALEFEERPDYRNYQKMFREHGKTIDVSYTRPWKYDWELLDNDDE